MATTIFYILGVNVPFRKVRVASVQDARIVTFYEWYFLISEAFLASPFPYGFYPGPSSTSNWNPTPLKEKEGEKGFVSLGESTADGPELREN